MLKAGVWCNADIMHVYKLSISMLEISLNSKAEN